MAVLLSQHSSNPLEDRTSDVRNKAFHDVYDLLSDDPLSGYGVSQMSGYWRHISEINPAMRVAQDEQYGDRSVLGMNLPDDELRIGIDHEKPPASTDVGTTETSNGYEVEEEEEAESDDSDANDDLAEEQLSEIAEEHTILLKPDDEQDEINAEIADLQNAVPILREDYQLVDRLGTGTFSSVYKAIDLHYHTKWDNSVWQGHHPPYSSAYYQSAPHEPGSKVFVAVKRIYVTSSPERIRNEIAILNDCRGCRHVSQLITAFRKHDQVVVIMPFQRNDDFRDYFRTLPLPAVKAYFRCLLRALRDIHARGIIHRDVKPANFLFDARTGIGTLCDFGLACRVEPGPSHDTCYHTPPSSKYPHGSKKDYDHAWMREMYKEARIKSNTPSDRVGYLEKDTRPQSKTNRAGTRGFRAPEVLFKCGDQSGAIDVWAAGIILLFFLTHKFPLFQSNDDTEALMELAAIFGRKKMETMAMLHGKTFSTNVPSVGEPVTWKTFVEKINPNVYQPPEPDLRYYPYSRLAPQARSYQSPPPEPSSSSPSSSSSLTDHMDSEEPDRRTRSPATTPVPESSPEAYTDEIQNAISLVTHLLNPDCTRRITPANALKHPFLLDHTDPMQDDDLRPNEFGQGVCGQYHFRDDVTDEHCVKIIITGDNGEKKEVVKTLSSGEGIPIGNEPCEFHRDAFYT